MTDSDGFYIPKHDHPALLQLLEQIPSLCEDLAITLTKQDRISTGGPRVRTGTDEQPLPFSPEASDAADLLHNTLHSWVRAVCEQRHLEPPHRNDTLHHARWLHRWHLALALTEGAQEAPSEIRYAIGVARRSVDRPREKTIERPEDESLEAVGLTKTELRIMIYERTKRRVTRKDLDNWISRGHITTIASGYYSLPSALAYLANRRDAA
ncbi:hypothetical protein [Rhodococcus artemisiae]|uniref:Uncharacterized protein n=1 Tax=Rhodococcus artemisiae TaxID=714159 RepID=A0ABU7LBP2_9NOCA|nr:hypothetical protein [Rhodococcus artemisiae]MEE2058959.1 hypothetical protein [Rhodococcus artemisiae]